MQKLWMWILGIMAGLIVLLIALDVLIDEPLRAYMERTLNERLQGYTTTLDRLDFHVFGFSLDLEEMTVSQDAHPDPPVAHIPQLTASVEWRALLSARVVADIVVAQPQIHINRLQLDAETQDEVAVQDRGWQEAVQAIYPLNINAFTVEEGVVTYIDDDPSRPLQLSQLNMQAGNIRNIHSQAQIYPSDIHLAGVVFESGQVEIDGQADFLAEPHLGLKANYILKQLALDYFKPIAQRYHMRVQAGSLSSAGAVEYAPDTQVVQLHQLTLHGLQLDYLHTAQAEEAEEELAQDVAQAAAEVHQGPELVLAAKQIDITDSILGFVNTQAKPDYRVFVTGTQFRLTNLSNQPGKEPTQAHLEGQFMDSGKTVLETTFRPQAKTPDFQLSVKIDDTQLKSMNDLLRAHGDIDVAGGRFSFYSELAVKDGKLDGYVKPLFHEMDVYDQRQDKDDPLLQKMYEGVVGGVASVLENTPRDEVATKTDISGDLEDPNTSTWQIVINLIQNAFFQAILPGFEKEVGRARAE